MRIVVHDHAGHAFAPQLSRALAARGHRVWHLYCSTFASAKGDLSARDGDTRLVMRAIEHRRPFAKYSYGRRSLQEVEYGVRASRQIIAMRPDVVISANTPMFSQAIMTRWLSQAGIANVLWLQDIYSDAVGEVVHAWAPPLRIAVARTAAAVEASTARRSDRVITIAPRFKTRLDEWGIAPDRSEVIPNWAPVDAVPVLTKDNAWSRSQGLDARFVVAYTGILGLKHDAAVLFELARTLPQDSPSTLLVVADGPGFRWLQSRADELGPRRLVCVPFQSPSVYPALLASADVLLAVLTPEASRYSVPSKVLTYLCAARPIVASMPSDNDAAQMLAGIGAGLVVPPGEVGGIVDAIEGLRADPIRRDRMGTLGREWAEASFAIDPIADRFEASLSLARARRSANVAR